MGRGLWGDKGGCPKGGRGVVVGDLTTPLPPFDKGDSTPKKIFK